MKKILFFITFIIINYNGFSQDHQINGRITDEEGNGLPGATIIIKETTTGTISDINGDFSLLAYKREEINVNGKSKIDIQLTPDIETLKEVVVVGYGSQEKINITGSVATIKQEKLISVPVANTSNLIAGKLPGVMTRQNSGLPGGENTQISFKSYPRGGNGYTPN